MVDRIALKFMLVYQRDRCAICGKGFRGTSVEMHEAILTRGNALKSDVNIMVPENCVLVHPGECHLRAHTEEGRVLCIKDLLRHEGSRVVSWLQEVSSSFRSGIADERIRLVMEVQDGEEKAV